MNTVDWASLAQKPWVRMKWREMPAQSTVCCVFGTPIHRKGTYYLRPAYFDGTLWMSQQAYKEMCRQVGKPIHNQYKRKRK